MTAADAMETEYFRQDGNEELWRTIFCDGHPSLAKKQRRYALLPGVPRCKLCYAPLAGAGGWIMRRFGLKPSPRNRRFCTACDAFLTAYPGGAETPLSIMFCDLRNSVGLSHELGPRRFAALVQRMRDTVIEELWEHDGFVLQFQGDSVIGVWPPGFSGPDHTRKALLTAEAIVKKLGGSRGEAIPLGVGMHSGVAFLCTVASANGELQEISAFGLDVNIAARLSAEAAGGQALVSAATYEAAKLPPPKMQVRDYMLKGVPGPTRAAVLCGTS